MTRRSKFDILAFGVDELERIRRQPFDTASGFPICLILTPP